MCTIDGCSDPVRAKGLCGKHYMRWHVHGDPLHVEIIRGDTTARLMSYVDQDGPLPTWAPFLGRCWLWTGGQGRRGYGKASVNDRPVLAHRAVYAALVGPIPAGLTLDHLCRVHPCVNPTHMDPVTNRVNVLRGVGPSAVNAVKTECDHGHPFDEENTYVTPDGRRQCRVCIRDRQAAYRRRLAA